MAILIAFYSRADENYFSGSKKYVSEGNTEKAAKMIAELTGGDLFKIEQKVPYAADYNTCIAQAKTDLQKKARPALVSMPASLTQYTDIYLGYPNYWGTMPMAVYTFLEAFQYHGITIHPFCTHEGSGLSRTVDDIRKAAVGANVAEGLAIFGSSVGDARQLLADWIKRNNR